MEAAAWRELREETNLGPDEVSLEAISPAWIGYELPEKMRKSKPGRGQVHRWFMFRMRSNVLLPPMPTDNSSEFRTREWITMAELTARTIPFRRPVYDVVASWFTEHLAT